MELSDLAAYKALDRDPTHIGYRGLDVYGMAPPSSGGSTVGEILNILEGYPDLGTMPRERALHLYLEASRLAYADRGAFVADPGYVSVPLAQLLSDQFAAQRRAKITETAATSPVPAGDPERGDRHQRVDHARGLDDQPDGDRPLGQRRRLHLHHRADRRQRHGRARLRLPAQQRAHRLQPDDRPRSRPSRTPRAASARARTRSRAASGRARRSRRPSSCATGGPSWRSARRAAPRSSRRWRRSWSTAWTSA